jgi:hypothetical protein
VDEPLVCSGLRDVGDFYVLATSDDVHADRCNHGCGIIFAPLMKRRTVDGTFEYRRLDRTETADMQSFEQQW